MFSAVLFFFGSCFVLTCYSLSTDTYFTQANVNHAKTILLQAVDSKDIPSTCFGLLGLKLLGETVPKVKELCTFFFNSANTPNLSTESLYYITTSYKTLGNCPQALPVMNIVKSLNSVLADNSNMQDIYYAVNALTTLSQKPQDIAKLIKTIQAILKKNDSLTNLGYLFHIASNLGKDGAFAFDRIEDAIVQADEVDSKYLQFDGGLSISGKFI